MMKKNRNTTIQITSETKKALDSIKKYRRETYNDLIMRILNETGKMEKGPKDITEKRRIDPPAELEY